MAKRLDRACYENNDRLPQWLRKHIGALPGIVGVLLLIVSILDGATLLCISYLVVQFGSVPATIPSAVLAATYRF